MSHSKWHISASGSLQYQDPEKRDRPLNIIYLEDQELFSRAIKDIILAYFPKALIRNIKNGDEALELVKRELEQQKKIDLIITDINHPGLPGYKFVYEMRELQKLHKVDGIPCIILSMVSLEDNPGIAHAGFFMADRYFTKTVEPDFFIEAVEELIC